MEYPLQERRIIIISRLHGSVLDDQFGGRECGTPAHLLLTVYAAHGGLTDPKTTA